MSWLSSLFGGGSSGGSSGINWGDAIIAGIGAYSSSRSSDKNNKNNSKLNKELVGLQGIEARKTTEFERALDYYYQQKDKLVKREALDTYGAFSRLSDYAPAGFALPAKPVVPTQPKA